MLKLLLTVASLVVSGGFGGDILKNTGLDGSDAMWGNLAGMITPLLIAAGLSKDTIAKVLTGLTWLRKNINESHLPNGTVGRSNWIADSLRQGVDPETLKPFWDGLWPVIVADIAAEQEPVAKEVAHA